MRARPICKQSELLLLDPVLHVPARTVEILVQMLVGPLRMKGLVIGPDFAFGKGRQGNEAFLKDAGEQLGFWVETVKPLIFDGSAVRSRRIRESITDGDLSTVYQLLGRNFRLSGEVVKGDKRGRELGFPTANVSLPPELIVPGDGI